jgi:MarR family transcriptional regulator, organic hydroperoxide resistance regulator
MVKIFIYMLTIQYLHNTIELREVIAMNIETKNNCCQSNEKPCTNNNDNCCVEEVGEVVQKLVRVLQMFERDQVKPHGFTSTQCYVLLEILKVQSLTMNELSDKLNLNSSTMTRIIDNLVRDEYITRTRDEVDRRIVLVSLTDKGNEAAKALNESVNNYYKKIIAGIPEGQVENVLNSVNLLLDAFRKANPNCC